MDEIYRGDGFLFTFPLRIIVRKNAGVSGILKTNHPTDGKLGIGIFSDEDLAKTFVEKNPPVGDHYEIQAVASENELLGLMIELEKKGVFYVFIDPEGVRTTWLTVAEVRNYCTTFLS